ncbi:unnamed protein product [Lupinus luteus]|uniref:Uncharacterized protein n=1 Tax=Lupinus luteus TaxID=3873 RepID=A0AAV1VWZ1_LUPLU
MVNMKKSSLEKMGQQKRSNKGMLDHQRTRENNKIKFLIIVNVQEGGPADFASGVPTPLVRAPSAFPLKLRDSRSYVDVVTGVGSLGDVDKLPSVDPSPNPVGVGPACLHFSGVSSKLEWLSLCMVGRVSKEVIPDWISDSVELDSRSVEEDDAGRDESVEREACGGINEGCIPNHEFLNSVGLNFNDINDECVGGLELLNVGRKKEIAIIDCEKSEKRELSHNDPLG